jgi:CubicO group peptidase (beta-lactamase class C family)
VVFNLKKMRNIRSLKCLLIVIAILSLYSNTKSYGQNLESNIDSLLLHKYPSNEPGATFLVSKNGNIIYNKAFGLANLELNFSMQKETVFEIGSMTKQFTAISILILMERGVLNLDDEITKYILDYPTNGNKITIHHLLTHTSGIKSFTSIKGINTIAKQDLTPLELIDFFKNEPIDFMPGEKFKYNNSGYVLLGYIIEKVSGQNYAQFVEEEIFKKLGMIASKYASHKDIIKNRASGYHKKDSFINNRRISFTIPYASGSLMSNVIDMFKWQEALKNNELISRKATEKAFTNYALNNGENIDYGYGWHIKQTNGISVWEHGGAIFGFKSMGVYLPNEDIYVIGLNNCDCNSPTEITRQIAQLAIGK